VQPYFGFFSAALDGATTDRQIPSLTFFQLRSSLRKDSVANYGSIWTQFPPSVRGLDVQDNALNVSEFRR